MLVGGVANMSHAGLYLGTARVPAAMQQNTFNTTRDILCRKPQCLYTISSCRLAIVPAAAAAAAAAARRHICRPSSATLSPSSSSGSSGVAIELRRTLLMQQLQDVLPSTSNSDMPCDNLPASSSSSSSSSGSNPVDQGYTPEDPSLSSSSSSAARRQSSISKGVKGFATGAGSSSSRIKQQHGRQQQQRVEADHVCPCHSGLKYKDCCQPFLIGVAKPRSALELVSARFTAAKCGNVRYLVSSTHPDSNLILGGARDLSSRTKRLCAYFRSNKMEIVGVAHCPGDQPGTWVVLTILQATTGDFAGEKIPYMELIARRNWTDTKVASNSYNKGLWDDGSAAAAAGSSGGSAEQQDWMYVGNMNSFPDNGQAEVLVQLVQRHCPEVLNSGSSGGEQQQQQQQQQSMAERDVYFVWTAPNLHVGRAANSSSSSSSSRKDPDGSSSSSGGGWYVDLLRSSVESIGSRQQQSQQAAVSEDEYKQMISQHHLLVPHGVFIMDDYVEQKGGK